MKKIMIALTMMLLTAATGKAMSYEQARNEALFLTDKMAYELNLTDAQYEAAYEINLDYLMGVTSYDDVFGTYWERRNQDLSYILLDWQWNAFLAATYFYRPLYWRDGFWHFGVYARYPHRDYFFFGRPTFYATYRGGHAWHVVGGRGYYHSRRNHYHHAHVSGRSHFGMLDRWNRGDFNHGHHRATNRNIGNTGHYGGPRSSSTQSTVNNPSHHRNSLSIENRATINSNRSNHSSMSANSSLGRSNSSRSFNREVTNSRSSGSFSRGSNTSRSNTSISRESSASRSSGSFSNGSSRSFSRGGSVSHNSGTGHRSGGSLSSGSSSAGRSSGGGHSYGGRR